MNHIFKKYWWVVLLISVLTIGIAVLIQNTKDTNDFARWIYTFIQDWAVLFSAFATVILAIAALATLYISSKLMATIKEERVFHILDLIKNWLTSVKDMKLEREPVDRNEELRMLKEKIKWKAMLSDLTTKGNSFSTQVKDKFPPVANKVSFVTGLINEVVEYLDTKYDGTDEIYRQIRSRYSEPAQHAEWSIPHVDDALKTLI